MGQSRKQQLDKIFAKYPNKSANQISKDHGIPYSTVWKYHKQYFNSQEKILADYRPREPKPKPMSFTTNEIIMAVVAGAIAGITLFTIVEYI